MNTKAFFLSLMLIVAFSMPVLAEESDDVSDLPKAPLLSSESFELSAGTVSEEAVFNTMYSLFPQDVFLLNEAMIASYAENPNRPYQQVLSQHEQHLFYEVSSHLLPLQARSHVHHAIVFTSPSVMTSPSGFQAVLQDTLGTYSAI